MKIALIRRRYSPHGGAEKYVDRLSQKLLALGHEVHLFSTEWPQRPGLVLHPLPLFRGPGLFKLFHFNRKVEKAVDRKAFEVIQSFEKTACQDIYRAGEGCHREWIRQRAKYEPLLKRMGAAVNPFHWLTLALERRLFERSDTRFFIANSQRGRQEILTHYLTAPEKIKVIYNAVEFPSASAVPAGAVRREREEKVLLFVGSGFRRKGLYFLIGALPAVLKEVKVQLIVVGEGNQKKAARLAARLGVDRQVSFIGPVKDPGPYYQAADLFVLPSLYEPFSNACLEAMSRGLPMVTTEMNGASEAILSGENGVVVRDPADLKDLAQAVIRALGLNREEVGPIHRQNLVRHTWEKHIEELLKLYCHVIEINNLNKTEELSPGKDSS
ncbi:MAG TPA: glycosyltransferase family 4 protein [Thermodesulfobacteriota bacterium]|nr:glycosyltransferase family 4 protein [Thermodesulfobacteriota bacterium]